MSCRERLTDWLVWKTLASFFLLFLSKFHLSYSNPKTCFIILDLLVRLAYLTWNRSIGRLGRRNPSPKSPSRPPYTPPYTHPLTHPTPATTQAEADGLLCLAQRRCFVPHITCLLIRWSAHKGRSGTELRSKSCRWKIEAPWERQEQFEINCEGILDNHR